MRFLIVNAYYQNLIEQVYSQNPGLVELSFEAQNQAWMSALYGSADWYSFNLQRLGHEAKDLVLNIEPLQRQWAKEHGVDCVRTKWSVRFRRGVVPWLNKRRIDDWMWKTLYAQIKEYKPDVLYFLAMRSVDSAFIQSVRHYVRLVVGQNASPLPDAKIENFDLVFSSLPNQVNDFKKMGLQSEYLKLGFESRALNLLENCPKKNEIVFVGGLGDYHEAGAQTLEYLAQKLPLVIWGYGAEKLSANSGLKSRFHGPLWGKGYYQALHDAKIVFNRHISVAEKYANNLRLFEGTGVGSLMLTDAKSNLSELFVPGHEVIAYETPEDALEKALYYLGHAEEREAVALAGQRRTLAEHTWYHRMQEMVEIVNRYL